MISPSARPSPPHHFSHFFLTALDASPANPVFSDSCGLFFSLGALFDVRLVCFQYLADSFCKTPGGGVPLRHLRALRACPFYRRVSALSFAAFLSPLCFHGLTNCFSRKPFILITICVAPRVWGPRSSPNSVYSVPSVVNPPLRFSFSSIACYRARQQGNFCRSTKIGIPTERRGITPRAAHATQGETHVSE